MQPTNNDQILDISVHSNAIEELATTRKIATFAHHMVWIGLSMRGGMKTAMSSMHELWDTVVVSLVSIETVD